LSLTIGYVASGKLALLLAVPPGYASPIFPPAGIAIAAMLIGGPATLPWTFLGSFLLNVWTAHSVGHGSVATWLAASVFIATYMRSYSESGCTSSNKASVVLRASATRDGNSVGTVTSRSGTSIVDSPNVRIDSVLNKVQL